jgi:hypothetical protein
LGGLTIVIKWCEKLERERELIRRQMELKFKEKERKGA